MSDSLTLTVSGRTSVLEVNYFPPIVLSPDKNYELGLIELLTFNSIPNIGESNNKFHIINKQGVAYTIVIHIGSYEIEDIESYLKKKMSNTFFSLKPNNNELCCEIICEYVIDFSQRGSIGQLLGFTQRILSASNTHKSDLPITILKVNALRMECSITSGAYINSDRVHTIHEFFPAVPPRYKIIEVPANVIYMPVTMKEIHHLQLKIVDQDGDLVNFRGETITIRLHLKSLK